MRVLLVEDDRRITSDVTRTLAASGYVVETVGDGEEAWFRGDTEDYGAIVLDLGLPKMDGISVLKRWRAGGRRMPVLILTARGSWAEQVDGIDAGADDYLVKPFDFGELLARIRALVRRGRQPLLPERLTIGPLTIDRRTRQVRVRNLEVLLTAKEYALLEYLVRRAGDVVSRADISEHVWDERHDPVSNVVDVYVQRLRRKLDRSGTDSLIRTRRGEGYQLVTGPGSP